MFKIGEYVVYGHNGVCQVTKIGPVETVAKDKDRLYYTLIPFGETGSTVFAPVDSQKIPMRKIISKEEAMELIDGMEEIGVLGITEERKREETYKNALKTCDCKSLISLIKTIYRRKQEREAQGKRLTAADSRYFRTAEHALYDELAAALEIESEKVKEVIAKRLGGEQS
nr:CarD family transcriptional regulator [uncultured Sellimonas sp.]